MVERVYNRRDDVTRDALLCHQGNITDVTRPLGYNSISDVTMNEVTPKPNSNVLTSILVPVNFELEPFLVSAMN